VHGGSTFKLLVLGLVLLMHGGSFLQFFWTLLRHVELVILMCGGQEVRSSSRFFLLGGSIDVWRWKLNYLMTIVVVLMCGGNNQ
jgi:hypothetical protein